MIVSITSIPAFAQESTSIPEEKILELPFCPEGETMRIPVGDAEYIKDDSGNLIKISDLLTFESQQEATRFIEEMLIPIEQPNPPISTRSTRGDGLVDSVSVAGGLGSINLRVSYTTSGDSNTGKITQHHAYTTFTGFTLGFGWDESMCVSQVTSSGKDIFAQANGVLTYNLLVDGFIELGRESVHLEGLCSVIH